MDIRSARLIAGIVVCVGVGLSGCASRTCDRLCEWLDEASAERAAEPWAGCTDACEQDYAAATNYCRASLGRLSRCVEGQEAEDAWDECRVDFDEATDECVCTIDSCEDECADEHGLRLPSDTCNAIVESEPDA